MSNGSGDPPYPSEALGSFPGTPDAGPGAGIAVSYATGELTRESVSASGQVLESVRELNFQDNLLSIISDRSEPGVVTLVSVEAENHLEEEPLNDVEINQLVLYAHNFEFEYIDIATMAYRRMKKRGRYGVAPKRSSGRMLANSTVARQLAVMINPFSVATTNPKIPDGLGHISAGVRLQNAFTIAGAAGKTVHHVLLFPGLTNSVYTLRSDDALAAFDQFRFNPFASHSAIEANNEQANKMEIAKWRVVSSGLRIALINNSDNNEGWWQAIRVRIDLNDLKLNEVGGGNPSRILKPMNNANPPVVVNSFPGVSMNAELVEHPTYQSGKLRDIHKHLFQLNPENEKHHFQVLEKAVVPKACVDPAYDAVYIRIHGNQSTMMLFHNVMNQEIIYDESATLARYQSECEAPKIDIEKVFYKCRVTRPSRLALP